MDEDEPHKQRVLTLLNALKEASRNLHTNSFTFLFKTHSNASTQAFLDLETKAVAIFKTHPNLRHLSDSLCTLRTLIEKLEKFKGFGLRSLLHRQITHHNISKLAHSIESEIQSYLDSVTVRDLVKTLEEGGCGSEEEQVKALVEFQQRLSQGFDLDFQDLILKSKVFNILERTLFEPLSSKRVQEEAAKGIEGLVKFNKNVFVGLVLMGPTIKALIAMASSCSIRVLSSLVSFIRSPLVDEILCNGEIPRIISFLCSEDMSLRVAALDCVLELAYIGRREVIEAMLEEDLIKILMDLQRSGELLNENVEDLDFPFASCVSRFAIQLEVGEGLTPEEKREVKLEVLKMVKEAFQSDAEVATITADILWGSSP